MNFNKNVHNFMAVERSLEFFSILIARVMLRGGESTRILTGKIVSILALKMKIFVGLGNPGVEYSKTKHNVGFMLADKLAENLNAENFREKFHALVAETFFGGEKILIVKPQTFMNLSGEAVGPVTDFFKIPSENLIVAHDDMDLPVGMIRLRPKGSGGGHHGIESIIQHLGGEKNFPRVRIGIGRPPENWSVNNHVLSPFNSDDAEKISNALENLIPAVKCIFSDGINMAMNKFNPQRNKS